MDFKQIYRWPFKKQLVIFILAFILVFIFLHWLILSTPMDNLTTLQKKEAELKTQISSTLAKEQTVKEEIIQFPQTQKLLEQWKDSLITRNKMPELINDILKIGANSHLNFAVFNPDNETIKGAYVVVPIHVVVAGTYHQISDFISQTANLPNVVSIANFTLSTEIKVDVLGKQLADQATAQNLLIAEFNFAIYFLSEKK